MNRAYANSWPAFALRCAILFHALVLTACVSSPNGGSGRATGEVAMRDYLALAKGYFEAGDLASARHHLDNVRAISSRQAEYHHVAALIAAAENDFELAERHFRHGLRLGRNDAAIRNNLGVLLHSLGRNREAAEQFRAAAADARYQGRGHALENLGRSLLRQQRQVAARQAFAAALRQDGELPLAALELSLLHLRDGNLDAARRLYGDYLNFAQRQRLPHGPKALLAGARIASQSGNIGEVEEFGSILGKLYPATAEFRAYLELIDEE